MKHRKIGKLGRRGIVVFAVLIAISLVASAGLLTYFGKISTTATVSQSVQIDGLNWNEPITEEFEAVGGCCYCYEHEVTNNGCDPIWLDWETWGTHDLVGIDVSFQRDPYLGDLVLSVLDGMAEYDDFEVFVDGQSVYTYMASGGAETWVVHTIDLLPFEIAADGTHTITVECIASEPWTYFDTYGQLAVDYVELYCELGMLCDSVDIGDTCSEAGHNLLGWGCVEPATHGGSWGGIDDCRVTWFMGDSPDASLDLTCEAGCGDCDGVVFMDEPFELLPGESIEFCICYDFDMLISPGVYNIHAKLLPAVI